MAKTAKVKRRAVSIHSRAARRGATPPPKDQAVVEKTEYKPWLHDIQRSGVTKKKKSKPLSRQQRQRLEKAVEKADMNVDKLEKKVADSKGRGKKIKARSMHWDDLNGRMIGKENQEDSPQQGSETGKVNTDLDEQTSKEMDGVEMPDLEQPLAIRVAEESAPSKSKAGTGSGEVSLAIAETSPQATNLTGDDLDEIT